MEMAFTGIANNSYFYTNKQVEPLQQSSSFAIRWYFIMGCMAGVTANLTHFYCMDTIAMDRNKAGKQQKIFCIYLYNHACMEYTYHLVDMECICYRCSHGIFCE